jgi:uncharacterized membrane protein
MRPKTWIVRAIWTVVIFLALIGIGAAIRRAVALSSPARQGKSSNPFSDFDGGFARHRVLTTVHIAPGVLFMVLGPLQFVRRIRSRNLWFHRLSGRVFVAAGVVIGVSALAMGFQTPIGGANETAATVLFAIIFLFDLSKAFVHVRRREIVQHREWMIRAFAIGLAVATMRPIVGVFFATSRLTRLTPQEFFGTAFWLGFTLHLIAAEVWIHYTRLRVAVQVSG